MYTQGGHATALYMYIPSHHISYCYCCPQHHSTVSSVTSPPLHSLPPCPSCCLPHSLHSPNSRTVVSESSGQSFHEEYLSGLSAIPATATIIFFVGVRWITPPPSLHRGVRDPGGRNTCREGKRRTFSNLQKSTQLSATPLLIVGCQWKCVVYYLKGCTSPPTHPLHSLLSNNGAAHSSLLSPCPYHTTLHHMTSLHVLHTLPYAFYMPTSIH